MVFLLHTTSGDVFQEGKKKKHYHRDEKDLNTSREWLENMDTL